MIWISGMGIEGVFECEILPNTFVDDNPVMRTLNKKKSIKIWTMNVNHLRDLQFIKHAKEELEVFFRRN